MNYNIDSESFFIELNDKEYTCTPLEKNGHIIYQIKFPGSSIYLTEAQDINGAKFWTLIPPDPKLNHIVSILVKQIQNKTS
jgi:hypothetical protein